MEQDLVLVDENDNEIGVAEKIEAHLNGGKLHRAFSIFVFNAGGKLLMQQRALDKYHGGGLWTNTCCSHPGPGESLENAVHRRLQEEMGFDCDLTHLDSFIYRAEFKNGLTEHEYDHVWVGRYDGSISPDSKEVANYKYIEMKALQQSLSDNPQKYTAWLKIAVNELNLFATIPD